MIKAVIFDCFGVLTVDNWRELHAPLKGAEKSEAQSLTKAYDLGLISSDQLAERVAELLGCSIDEAIIAMQPQSHKNLSLLDYIRELRSRNYKIGLLSNINNNWIRQEFLTEDEQKLFDNFILSYEVSLAKPDSEIYTLAANRLKVDPTECIFVDDVVAYCLAAESLGMKAVVYEDFVLAREQIEKYLEAR